MVSIILSAYNEESSIEGVINEIERVISGRNWEVIVVDDGSTDKTAEIVRKYDFINLVRHPYNKGYGASVKTGIANSQGKKIVLVDADSQHDPLDIELLLSHLGEFDLVVGARGVDYESKISRRVGNYFLNKFSSFLVNVNILDLTSGLRAFDKEKMLKFMHLYPNGFSISATTVLAFISAGFNVKFLPVKMRTRNNQSKSKVNLISDGFKFFILILRMITLFNPLKIFFPVSLLLFVMGFGYGAVSIFLIRHIPAGATLLIITSLIIFFFGLIADQISCIRREI